jgi:hypothetical protein
VRKDLTVIIHIRILHYVFLLCTHNVAIVIDHEMFHSLYITLR